MKTLFFLILFPALAHAGPYYEQVISTTAGTSTMTISGYIGVAASSTTPTTYKFRIDGPGGYLQFPDGTKQITAGVASSTISVNTSQFSGNGASATPLNLVTSSVTLQGPIVSSVTAAITEIADETTLTKSGMTFSAKSSSVTLQGNSYKFTDYLPLTGGNLSAQLTSASSMTATYFVGNGSALTNIPGDSFGSHIATKTITTAYAINSSSDIAAIKYHGDGSLLTGISAADNLGNHVATTTLNMAGFPVNYISAIYNDGSYSQSSAGNIALLTSTQTFSGGNTFTQTTVLSSVTLSSNYTTGFTQLGSNAPKIKIKKITGTTASQEGGSTDIAHGITDSKIIAATCVVWYDETTATAVGELATGASFFYRPTTNGYITIYNHATNSENILSKPLTCIIIYEE